MSKLSLTTPVAMETMAVMEGRVRGPSYKLMVNHMCVSTEDNRGHYISIMEVRGMKYAHTHAHIAHSSIFHTRKEYIP